MPAQADLAQGTFRPEIVHELRNAWQHQLQIDHSSDPAGHQQAEEMVPTRFSSLMPEQQGDDTAEVRDRYHVKASGVSVKQRQLRSGKATPPAPASGVDRLDQKVDHQRPEQQRENIAAKFGRVARVPGMHREDERRDHARPFEAKTLQ